MGPVDDMTIIYSYPDLATPKIEVGDFNSKISLR